ncbi:MAG: SDR family oxidoreductase [Spirochaetia bacterium]|jgi:short-subunit dehydrogenase
MKRTDRFKDKVVWITGASSGIGESLARKLDERGARLILSSNEPAELKRVATGLKNAKTDVMILPLDLDKIPTLASKGRKVLARFGRVDILINNGGISQRALAENTTIPIDVRIMNTDFLGHVALTKSILPSMLARRSGHIVVTSSIMGKMYTPLRSTYCAAKHALHGFFDSLRSEVWKQNVHVTIVCPTGVSTSISLNALTSGGRKYRRMDEAQSKGMTPDECADEIVRAIAGMKEEAIIGKGFIRYASYVRRFFPGIYSRLIRSAKIT